MSGKSTCFHTFQQLETKGRVRDIGTGTFYTIGKGVVLVFPETVFTASKI